MSLGEMVLNHQQKVLKDLACDVGIIHIKSHVINLEGVKIRELRS